MNYYPIFINLENKKVLIIGGGEVAFRKIKSLLNCKAKIDIIAKNFHKNILDLIQKNKINCLNKDFQASILDNYYFVITATNDYKLNQYIFECCEKTNKLCNVVDNSKLCSFIIPAIVNRNPFKIAITSSGYAPVLARIYKEQLETMIPSSISKATELAGKYRDKIKNLIPNILHRKNFWEKIFESNFISYIEKQEFKNAEKIIVDFINGFKPPKGEICLIGAGPGKLGMLTLDACYALQKADVILHDELITPEILNISRKDAQTINVGKRHNAKHHYNQDAINKLLIQYFKQDKLVIRLKSGDPFIFGRGGEELLFLLKNNIHFKIIPGITSGIGIPSSLGMPLTYRNISKTLILISGHVIDEYSIQWDLLINDKNTIVIYMGLNNANLIQQKLIEKGKNPNTPFAIISSGTTKEQSTIIGKLHQLSIKSKQAKTPAIIVIGKIIDINPNIS